MDYIDLHIHTTASDGSLDPTEIVDEALELGLYAIAITDHETVDAVPYAIKAAENTPLQVIPGVEISTMCGDTELHVLGYGIDPFNQFLIDTLEGVSELHYERNVKMCEALQKFGMDISVDKIYSESHSRMITRGTMGRYLVRHGYVKDIKEAFEKYLGTDTDYYIPKFKLSLEDAYKLITYAGGICSLAHPVQYKFTDEQYMELFAYLKKIGFKAIEAIHSDNGPDDESKFKKMAIENDLLITGGSDFHGFSKPDIHIGTGRGNLKISKSILKSLNL